MFSEEVFPEAVGDVGGWGVVDAWREASRLWPVMARPRPKTSEAMAMERLGSTARVERNCSFRHAAEISVAACAAGDLSVRPRQGTGRPFTGRCG